MKVGFGNGIFQVLKGSAVFDQENHKFVQNFSLDFFVIEICINKVAKNYMNFNLINIH